MCSAYTVEAHNTVNNIAILTFAQEYYVENITKAHFGSSCKISDIFSEFNQI